MFYWLIPKIYRTTLHSKKAADAHFWMATTGIVAYMIAMWVSGVNQGLMWRATNADGTLLYPSFVETLLAIRPMYIVRMLGGTMYLAGFGLMIWNLAKTIKGCKASNTVVEVVVKDEPVTDNVTIGTVLAGRPLWFTILGLALATVFVFVSAIPAVIIAILIFAVTEIAYLLSKRDAKAGKPSWFGIIERRPLAFTVLTLVAVLIGGVAELLPTILVKQAVPHTGAAQKPYTPLELQGRDLYVREGCYVCHSQMIRPMVAEFSRYGEASRAEEFIYDHPFQWGSKRTGPDLHRVGGRYPNLWHYTHMVDPRATSPGSNMPSYAFLTERSIDAKLGAKKLLLMQKLGVPYSNEDIDGALAAQQAQGEAVVADLAVSGVEAAWDSEMVAMIAYLQRLGRDQGVLPPPPPVPEEELGEDDGGLVFEDAVPTEGDDGGLVFEDPVPTEEDDGGLVFEPAQPTAPEGDGT
jgi:cytochrome c oxidase cbb3-type subunit I/II